MTLKALCVTLGLLGLLSGDAIASPFNDSDEPSNIKTEETIELFVTCEASFPLLSLDGMIAITPKLPRQPVLF
jgi:hypothetical protein